MQRLENMNPSLKKFIEEVDALVQKGEPEKIVTKKVAEAMEKLLSKGDVIPEAYKQPNPDKYTLYPVYISPDNSFSIASAVWDVGQSTPVHNHTTWGVIGLIQGEEHEIHYDVPTEPAPLKIIEKRSLRKGEVMVCCTSDQDVHKVTCASNEPCVGIHVYGGNIGELERHVYDELTGSKKAVVTAWDPVPQ